MDKARPPVSAPVAAGGSVRFMTRPLLVGLFLTVFFFGFVMQRTWPPVGSLDTNVEETINVPDSMIQDASNASKDETKEVVQVAAGNGTEDNLKASSPEPDTEEEKNNSNSTESIYDMVKRRPRAVCPSEQRKIQLFFPHVNKAGGRTIEATFAKPYHHIFRPVARNVRSYRREYDLIDSHRDYETLNERLQATAVDPSTGAMRTSNACMRWIFFLRHPFERTLSAFHTTTGRSLRETSKGLDQNHFPCRSARVRNLLTQANFTFENFTRLPAAERATCERDIHVRYLAGESRDLDLAKQRVLEMDAIGLVSEFALSMQLMNWELDLSLRLYTPVFNKNDHDSNVSPEARRVLEEMNSKDLQLYEFVKDQVFKPRVEAMREHYGGTFPWGDVPSVCDKKVVCWDRRKALSPVWSIREDAPVALLGEDILNVGIQKQFIICGPLRGCTLDKSLNGTLEARRRRRLKDRVRR